MHSYQTSSVRPCETCTSPPFFNLQLAHIFLLIFYFFHCFLCLFRNYSYFCTLKSKRFEVMTALQLNAELFRELSIIAEDEGLMKKALKAIKRLSAKKQAMDETEYIMSSPEMVRIIRQGEKDIEEGRGRVIKLEDIWK